MTYYVLHQFDESVTFVWLIPWWKVTVILNVVLNRDDILFLFLLCHSVLIVCIVFISYIVITHVSCNLPFSIRCTGLCPMRLAVGIPMHASMWNTVCFVRIWTWSGSRQFIYGIIHLIETQALVVASTQVIG